MVNTLTTPWSSKQYLHPTEEAFRILHEVYRGPQDNYDRTGEKPHRFVVSPETPRRIISDPIEWKNTIYMTHPLNKSDRATHEIKRYEGVTNIRLEGSPDALATVASVELNIGGMRFDKVFADPMGCFSDSKGTLNFWHTNEGRVIPAIQHHNINIIIQMDRGAAKNVRLVYDIVSLPDWKVAEPYELPTVQHQFKGVEHSSGEYNQRLLAVTGRYQYRCNFNHPILEILMRTEHPIKEARLILNNEYELPLERGENGIWSILFSKEKNGSLGDLTTTLNASRIDNLRIQVEPEEGTTPGMVWIWSKNFHMARVLSGMIGLAFIG